MFDEPPIDVGIPSSLWRITPGESVTSYINRLARANHLRPSLVHAYVRDPLAPGGGVRPDLLAAVSARTITAIEQTFPDLAKPTAGAGVAQRPATISQKDRKQALFAQIPVNAADCKASAPWPSNTAPTVGPSAKPSPPVRPRRERPRRRAWTRSATWSTPFCATRTSPPGRSGPASSTTTTPTLL